MAIEWKKLEVSEEEGPEEEYKVVWRCYSCGASSDEGGTFREHKMWTDYGYEYDCICNTCESDHTAEDGESAPECPDCPAYSSDWYCDTHRKTCCSECWEWFDTPDGEPEEYLCPKCDPPDDGKVTVPAGQDPDDEEFKP